MSNNSVTIITTVYGPDIPQLYIQAHSLLKNWEDSKNWIIIADDDESFEYATNEIKSLMIGWNVVVKFTIAKSEWGWHRQQISKIFEGFNVTTEYSIILDAKNFLIKKASLDNFLINGTWIMTGQECEFYKKYMSMSEETLQIKNNSVIPASITPWIWETNLVRRLVRLIPNFTEWNEMPGTEFFMYWLVAQNKIQWCPKVWVSGLWSGNYFFEQTTREINDYKKRPELYWWAHHMGHTSDVSKDLTIEMLKNNNTITDHLVFEKWKKLSAEAYEKHIGPFSIYISDPNLVDT